MSENILHYKVKCPEVIPSVWKWNVVSSKQNDH
jgi:hypothetical protein